MSKPAHFDVNDQAGRGTIGEKATGGTMIEDFRWLNQHAAQYYNHWIALDKGRFLGAHTSHFALYQILMHAGTISNALFIRIESPE